MNGEEIRKIENQINNLLMDEDVYWKQRSRANWLREGDKNTRFFHSKATAGKRKNKIWGIEDAQGNWRDNQEEIEREFFVFFQVLFTSSNPSQNQTKEVLKRMLPMVTSEMNAQMEESFTPEDITNALSQMCPTKAPGPDSLTAAFFQKHWLLL